MTEYNRIARGSFVSTGGAQPIYLPFQPTVVELYNYTVAFTTPTENGVYSAYWDASMGQGFATETVYNSSMALTADAVVTGGISTFAGSALQTPNTANQQIVGITKASQAVVTVDNHGYSIGQTVIMFGLKQSASTGMQQIAGMYFTIIAVTTNTFTINWDTNQSNYTALSGSPTGAFVQGVPAPFAYVPELNVISTISLGTTTTVSTTQYHNFVVGQQIAFRMPTPWGAYQLNSLNGPISGSPMYGYVTSITNNYTFVCNINSTGFTAYNTNQPFVNYPGEQFPGVLATGDVNSGGWPYTGGNLYPSPSFPTYSGGIPSINGPAIQGAFVNNTGQGFIIGAGAGVNQTSSVLVGASTNLIYWKAFLGDF